MTIMQFHQVVMIISNMNYTGSMKDCAKGCTDMERRCEELLHGISILPTMGSAYYTTPSEVKNPGIVFSEI